MKGEYRLKLQASGEPLVDQGIVHGCGASWNPDDDRFYITKGELVLGTFKRWANAVAFAKRKEAA